MLSILIPTYNYNTYPLVLELKGQADLLSIDYEILVQDDFSSLFIEENSKINELENCSFEINKENLGRSKIRNFLANKAKFDWLLFLDADTFPLHSNFISSYLIHLKNEEKVIYGGITYCKEMPLDNKTLRWFYGKKREAIDYKTRNLRPYISFLTLNFLIPKTFFKILSFNETIPNLRHEDTLFSYEMFKRKIPVLHINNPVEHFGLDTNSVFLDKTKESVIALENLIQNNLIDKNYIKLSYLFSKIDNLRFTFIFKFIYKYYNNSIEKKLCSNSPSLFLYDLYRICFYSTFKKNKNV